MQIKSARFIASNTKISQLPDDGKAEFAFIGRSNVGKSSLINRIVGRKDLAKTSQKPGKTQQINHFLIDEFWYIVDLPGYGYAKVSKSEREAWSKFIRNYFHHRESLQCVFLLIDSRIPPQVLDLEFANQLGELGIPFVLVYTKTDKIGVNAANQNAAQFRKEMLKSWEACPEIFFTSSETGYGKEKILDLIADVLQKLQSDKS